MIVLYETNTSELLIQNRKNCSFNNVSFQISSSDYELLKNIFHELNIKEIVFDKNGIIFNVKIIENNKITSYQYSEFIQKINIFKYNFFRELFEDKINKLNFFNNFS